MAQDTRKDPRAKVLTMTVRYKSATLDEFIEHHSYDVSRGGMFIKTPSPFPPGTLLKFEVKIAEDKKLMQGVGRVVWKREPPDQGTERPAGMGVKFIKIDDDSKNLIDKLDATRGDEKSAYEEGQPQQSGTAVAVKPGAGPARKATMIGLGTSPSEPAKPEPNRGTADQVGTTPRKTTAEVVPIGHHNHQSTQCPITLTRGSQQNSQRSAGSTVSNT